MDREALLIDFTHTELFKGTLTHYHYDTFRLDWSTQMMLPSGTANFVVGADGAVSALNVVVENPDFDFSELRFIRE